MAFFCKSCYIVIHNDWHDDLLPVAQLMDAVCEWTKTLPPIGVLSGAHSRVKRTEPIGKNTDPGPASIAVHYVGSIYPIML